MDTCYIYIFRHNYKVTWISCTFFETCLYVATHFNYKIKDHVPAVYVYTYIIVVTLIIRSGSPIIIQMKQFVLYKYVWWVKVSWYQ